MEREIVYKLIIIIFICLNLWSCSINGSFQGLYGYQNIVSEMDSNLIKSPKSSVCELKPTKTPTIYKINGNDLKPCINSIDSSLLYIWSPNCSSDICVSLKTLEQKCNEMNVELFIVAEYYDLKKMVINYFIKRPIFGIDCDYYNSNLTSIYLSKFLADVLGNKKLNDNFNYYLFNKGKLVSFSNDLEKIRFQQLDINNHTE